MMSNRLLMNSTAMSPASTDADFGFAPMPQPYPGFFDAGNMSIPGLLGHQQQQHNNLHDNFDLAAAGFPFHQADSSSLLPPPPPSMANMTTTAMPSPSSLHQMPLVTLPAAGVPTADLYHLPFGGGSSPFLMKWEDDRRSVVDHAGGGRIGLNLGRRTYFSPADVLAVDRLLMARSSRLGGVGLGMGMTGVLGLGLGGAHHHQPPRCQAEGCKADLSAAKHYHRRHKVCEYHAKAATVAAAGKQQRFCQQCSRFHVLAEFDNSKRSCRKRLTEHNRRRRKPASAQDKEDSSPPPKRADTTTYNDSDHKSASAAAAKSTAISPNGSGVSCLDTDNNNSGHTSIVAAAPTALSLAALPEKDDGGLDTVLMMHQVHGRRDDGEDEQHFMTSLVLQAQKQHQLQHHHNGGGDILSCSSVSDHQQHQNGGSCNGFFEVDFI